MSEVRFYHLTKTPVEKALPQLLDKALQQEARVLILAEDKAQMEQLDAAIWTFHPDKFMPHGTMDDPSPQRQPALIAIEECNDNQPDMLFVASGAMPKDVTAYKRVIVIFDGLDGTALERARDQWKAYKAIEKLGALSYWQQGENGQWQQAG